MDDRKSNQSGEPWQSRASCKGMDPKIFFNNPTENEALAKRICDGCDVRQPCLDFALKTNQEHGIWGGYNESERRKLIKTQIITDLGHIAT